MIRGMKKRGPREWSVYVLRCADASLYTGIAKDVQARLAKHACGKGAAYTRTHRPVVLVYQEHNYTRSAALRREAAIKRFSRPLKEKLVATSETKLAAFDGQSDAIGLAVAVNDGGKMHSD